MTYQLYYTAKDGRDYVLFDIEYYLKKVDNSEGWYSEISTNLSMMQLTFKRYEDYCTNDMTTSQNQNLRHLIFTIRYLEKFWKECSMILLTNMAYI